MISKICLEDLAIFFFVFWVAFLEWGLICLQVESKKV